MKTAATTLTSTKSISLIIFALIFACGSTLCAKEITITEPAQHQNLPFATETAEYGFQCKAKTGLDGPRNLRWSWSVTDLSPNPLPQGLRLDPDTGLVSGKPELGDAGHRVIIIVAEDADAYPSWDTAMVKCQLKVKSAPELTFGSPGVLFPATERIPYKNFQDKDYQFLVSPTEQQQFTTFTVIKGSLPAGLILSEDGLLSGTPVDETHGEHIFTIGADDGEYREGELYDWQSGKREYTLIVNLGSLEFVPMDALPVATAGEPYSFVVPTWGGLKPFNWGESYGFPYGLSIDPISGEISGTPPACTAFKDEVPISYEITLIVYDSVTAWHPQESETLTLTLSIEPGSESNKKLEILAEKLPSGNEGAAYAIDFGIEGGLAPFYFSVVGFPSPSFQMRWGESKWVLEGTLPAESAGIYAVVISVEDSCSVTNRAEATYLFTVNEQGDNPLEFRTTYLLPATIGGVYSMDVHAQGGTEPYRFYALGLPSGLTLTEEGHILGAAQDAGEYEVVIFVEDSALKSAQAEFLLIVYPPNQGNNDDDNGPDDDGFEEQAFGASAGSCSLKGESNGHGLWCVVALLALGLASYRRRLNLKV